MIAALIKAVTLTYIISDILIVILSAYISCKCMFATTLRTVISSTTSSIFFKSVSIIHTEIIYIIIVDIVLLLVALLKKHIG